MKKYDPNTAIDPLPWLALDEQTQIELVRSFHEATEPDLAEEALGVHSSLHIIVENQLAMELEYIPQTVAKLMRQGLDRHESIHAIGAIIIEDVFAVAKGEQEELSPAKFRRKFEKLTAKRWLKGQY